MLHDVFISHSARDKEVANAICHRMEEAGIRCWIAPRDVQPGQAWDDAIVEALAATRLVVLVFSAAANQSRPVRNEVAAALDANKIVFPFRIENIVPSGGLQFHLSRVHWLDAMSPPLDAHIDNLVANAKRQLGQSASDQPPPIPIPAPAPNPVPAPSPVAAVAPPPRSMAGMMIGAVGGVALLLAGGLAAYVWMQKREPPPAQTPPTATAAVVPVAPAPPAVAAPPPVAAPPVAAQPPAAPPAEAASAAAMPAPALPPSAQTGDFVLPGSDSRLLSAGDLAGLSCAQLEIARNEIFARRGRYFQRADLQNHFARFAWYHPTTWNPALNPAEQANVALIAGTESRNRCR